VLVSLLGAVVWRAKESRDAAKQREQMVLLQEIQLKKALPPPPIPPVPAVTPMTYVAVAQNMLFARDRNPNVIVKPAPVPPPPPPMPDLPTASGAMTFNGETSVFLTARSGGPQKVYRTGDTIGPFKLVSVTPKGIVFDWEGKLVERRFDELKPKENMLAQNTNVSASAPPVASSQSVVSVAGSGSTDKSSPGADTGVGQRTCQVGDTSPNGTVVNGYRKVIAASMMGQSCHWEAVK